MTNDSVESVMSAVPEVPAAEKYTEEITANDEEKPKGNSGAADGRGQNDGDYGFDESAELFRRDNGTSNQTTPAVDSAKGEVARGADDDAAYYKRLSQNTDDAYMELINDASPTEEKKNASSSTVDVVDPQVPANIFKDEKTDDLVEALVAAKSEFKCEIKTGGSNSPAKKATQDPPALVPRLASNGKKIELRSQALLNSAKTVDSWGGKEGSLSPLHGPQRHTMPEFPTMSVVLLGSEGVYLDDDDNNCNHLDPTGLSSRSQDDAPTREEPISSASQTVGDLDESFEGSFEGGSDIAKYVNFQKLAEPSSSEYYYSEANRSNRQVLDKVNSKKKKLRAVSLDGSLHSKLSILTQRSLSAAYRGPKPKMKDGSIMKSALKKPITSNRSSEPLPPPILGRAASENSSGPRPGPMKRCSFSFVDVREHERIAGDNPCVTTGVPLSIGWGYYQHDPVNLDDYEFHKGPPRDKIEMMIPALIRRSMLRDEFGVSISEMNAAMKDVNVTKRHRRNTVATEHLEGWTEVLQSAKRKLKRFVKGTSTAKEENKMWANAHKSAIREYLKQHGEGSVGKNPEAAGTGSTGVGPMFISENSDHQQAPCLEISFHRRGDGEGGAPSF